MPEEIVEDDAQNSLEIHHLDESSGDVTVETVAAAAEQAKRHSPRPVGHRL